MKNKIHLFYGIIIGILLCACVGGTSDTENETENTATNTNQVSDQNENLVATKTEIPTSNSLPFKKEVKTMFGADEDFDEDSSLFPSVSNWKYGITSNSSSLAKMYKDGWRIVEVVKTNASAQNFQLLVVFER